ncbi:phytoene desaturase family protein [Hazenella coriacea]|uniref:4,4'-diaponeurosporene oxygenase n=1 Tax=Hazenella coriacea TaxID=1179467 RepID=A0A4R3LE91_9BACL|nr:phytoene desaturase family protein [Hazenella coriacea]TCS96654.1 phytoene desaturase [Hazenella coriacea]
MKKGVVIGGGIAGLVSASVLAAKGYQITLLERQATLGGKLQDIQLKHYRFDLGPSTITMPWIFERVFREAGKTIDPALRFIPLAVNSRNFFANGSAIDLTADPDYMAEQLVTFSPENRSGFLEYLSEIQRMYEIVEDHFFENPMVEWRDYFKPELIKSLLSVHPLQSMDSFHRKYFDDPRLISMMNRYATYVGSSPYETPATFSLIAYLEMVQGVYYIEGGNYRLIEALERLAQSVGVKIVKECPAEMILTRKNKVVGVLAGGEDWDADFVISNVDVRTTQEKLLLLPKRKIRRDVLSFSSFLCLFGVNKKFPHLHHHNHFFPRNYGREFIDIFEQKTWPLSPAIYICNSGFSEIDRAGKGSNLYALVHVPAKDSNQPSTVEDTYKYRSNIVHWLENNWKLEGLSDAIEVERWYGPSEMEKFTGAWQGSLYGSVSHGKKAFFRPPMKEHSCKGLYYTGGTTHPGGGTPMTVLSGLTVANLIQREDKK